MRCKFCGEENTEWGIVFKGKKSAIAGKDCGCYDKIKGDTDD